MAQRTLEDGDRRGFGRAIIEPAQRREPRALELIGLSHFLGCFGKANSSKAELLLKRAVRGGSANAAAHLASLFMISGESEEALKFYRTALNMGCTMLPPSVLEELKAREM